MEQIDPQAKALASAIRKAETGDDPNAYSQKGASGEYGGYQFTEPTWKGYAKEILGDENADITSIENQNKVAYGKVKQWKDAGYNPAQIASMWNAGDSRPNAYAENHRGVNSYGVQYDTPAYAQRVSHYYNQLKQQQPVDYTQQNQQAVQEQKQALAAQGKPVSVNSERAQPTFAGQIIRDVAKLPLRFLASGIGLLSGKDQEEKIKSGDLFDSKYLGKVYPVGYGKTDTGEEISPENNFGKSLASSIGTGLEAASYLTGGEGAGIATKGIQQGLKGATGQVLKKAGEGAITGGATGLLSGAGSALSQGKDLGTAASQGVIGGALGAATGGVLGGASPLLGRGANEASDLASVAKVNLGGEVTPKAFSIAQKAVDNEVDRVAQSLPPGLKANQNEILKKTGSNGFSIWKQHGLVPEQNGTVYSTQNIQDSLQPWIDKASEVTKKFADKETKAFNIDESINEVLSSLDKANISTDRKVKLAGELTNLINKEVTPILEKSDGRYVDASTIVKLKQLLYNEAGLSDDLITQGRAGKVFDSPYYAFAKSLTENVDKNATLPGFKKANKTFSDYLSANMLAKKLDGKAARSTEGLVGKIARRGIFGGAGAGVGGIPGAYIGNLTGEAMDKFFTDPSFRTKFFRNVLSKSGKEMTLDTIGKNLEEQIQKRGVSKIQMEQPKKTGLLDQFGYKPNQQELEGGYILKDGKVSKKK